MLTHDLDHYQQWTETTAIYKESVLDFLEETEENQADFLALIYAGLGLAGETGEVIELIKKQYRNHAGELSPEFADAIKDEVGDVLYYLARVCEEAGFDLSDALINNMDKLEARKRRGTLKER